VQLKRSRKTEESLPEASPAGPPTGIATKVLFAPVKLVSRRVAPRLSARVFKRVWGAIDGGAPPPRAEEPQGSVAKLGLALAVEGALTAIVRGLVDHVSRREFARVTGRWPGRRKKR
jgi:hypothetical protein